MTGGSPSTRHHFVPQFYFRAWNSPETGLFWLYQRNPAGRVESKERSAKSVGFVPDLYSWKPEGLDFRSAPTDQLERDIFMPLDNAASLVHQKLITSGLSSLSAEDRSVWALFLESLMERSPRRIREVELSADLPGTFEVDLAQIRPRFELSPGIRAFLGGLDRAALIRNTILGEMVRHIYDLPFLETLVRMQWLTLDLPAGGDHFLTGDAPLVFNGGARETPIYVLSIAISPTRLFVIHQKDGAFDRSYLGLLAQMHSINMVRKAESYVVSSRLLADSEFIRYQKVVDQALSRRP